MSDTLLEFTELSRALEKLLVKNNLVTVQDVATITDAELLRLPNLGRRKLVQIRAVIPHRPDLVPERTVDLPETVPAEQYRAAATKERARRKEAEQREREKGQQFDHDRLYLQVVLSKCARQFHAYADVARAQLRCGNREPETMDALIHNRTMAAMCEEAIKR